FYLRQLLRFDRPEERAHWKALLALAQDEGETRSFLALAAAVRRGNAPADVDEEGRELEQRLTQSLEKLEVLARWLQPRDARAPAAAGDPLAWLVAELEQARRSAEDATAAKLFSEAAGFAPGRLAPDTLLECFDHGWLLAQLGWDRPRLAEWAETVRA